MVTLAGDAYEGLDPMFAARLKAMVQASGGRITLRGGSYGFRSYEDQVRIWNQAVAKYGSEAAARKWAAVPGKSNHGKGFAYDLGYQGDGQAWAQQNAARFGLFFPMNHEPWHVEPIRNALDENFEPEAYTEPPIGGTPVGDPHDPGFQMTRMLAMLDNDYHGALTGVSAGEADVGAADLSAMGPAGGTVVMDDGAAMTDLGYAEALDVEQKELQEMMDDGDR